jgi:hypothetical protein
VLRLAADENFNARIVRGLRRRVPATDVRTVQQAGLGGEPDAAVLEWAASESRVLLTHDVATVIGHAMGRVRIGLAMPGVIAVPSEAPIGSVVEDLVLVLDASEADSLEGQVLFVPL